MFIELRKRYERATAIRLMISSALAEGTIRFFLYRPAAQGRPAEMPGNSLWWATAAHDRFSGCRIDPEAPSEVLSDPTFGLPVFVSRADLFERFKIGNADALARNWEGVSDAQILARYWPKVSDLHDWSYAKKDIRQLIHDNNVSFFCCSCPG